MSNEEFVTYAEKYMDDFFLHIAGGKYRCCPRHCIILQSVLRRDERKRPARRTSGTGVYFNEQYD